MEEDIWFVDDDIIFRAIVKKFMEDTPNQSRVKYFDDGDIAMLAVVRAAQSGATPRLIFLDLNMKHLKGWQMVDLLNEFERDVNIIIVSSSLNEMDLDRAKNELLVKEFISKPIDNETIQKKIKEYG